MKCMIGNNMIILINLNCIPERRLVVCTNCSIGGLEKIVKKKTKSDNIIYIPTLQRSIILITQVQLTQGNRFFL